MRHGNGVLVGVLLGTWGVASCLGRVDPPDSFQGAWAGRCHRWAESPDGGSFPVRIDVEHDGLVRGTLGRASIRNGRVSRNVPGNDELGAPEHVIRGSVHGRITPDAEHERFSALVWLDDGRMMCDLTATTMDSTLGLLLGVGEMRCDCADGLEKR